MSWGTELWDQPENLSVHSLKGIDFLERYGAFLKDRASVEFEYAKNLKNLGRKYVGKFSKADDLNLTYVQSFQNILSELNDMASQHEVIAEGLKEEAVGKIHDSVKETKEQRRQCLEDIRRLQHNLEYAMDQLDRSRREYVKLFKESRAADWKFQKSDADMNLSRAEVEKAKNQSLAKNRQLEEAKNSYAHCLQKTNEQQRDHYQNLLPGVLDNLRKMDEQRIILLQSVIQESVETEKRVLPLIQKCLDGMLQHADSISEQKDILHVVAKFRSGYSPPQDLEFLILDRDSDLRSGSDGGTLESAVGNGLDPRYSSPPSSGGKKISKTGTVRNRLKKSVFSRSKVSMPEPPQQKVNRLQQELDSCQAQLLHETSGRDGLLKLENTYKKDPSKGDLASVQRARADAEGKIEVIRATIEKLEANKAAAENELNMPIDVAVNNRRSVGKGEKKVARNFSQRISGSVDLGSSNGTMRSHGSANGLSTAIGPESQSVPAAVAEKHAGGGTADDFDEFNSRSSGSTDTFESDNLPDGGPSGDSSISATATAARGGGGLTTVAAKHSPRSSAGSSLLPPQSSPLPPTSKPPPPPEAEYNVVPEEMGGGPRICTAAYSFDSSASGSDNTVSMLAGERLEVIEDDDGDGWTRVRTGRGEAGFVPTSYLSFD